MKLRTSDGRDISMQEIKQEAGQITKEVKVQLKKDMDYVESDLEGHLVELFSHGYRKEKHEDIFEVRDKLYKLLFSGVLNRLYEMGVRDFEYTMLGYALRRAYVGDDERFDSNGDIKERNGVRKETYEDSRESLGAMGKRSLIDNVRDIGNNLEEYIRVDRAAAMLGRDARYVRNNIDVDEFTRDLVLKVDVEKELMFLERKEELKRHSEYMSAVEIGDRLGVNVDFVYTRFNHFFESVGGKEVRYVHQSKLGELEEIRDQIYGEYDKYNPLDYFLVKELAYILGKTDVTVSKWVKDKRLGEIVKINNGYRIHYSYVEKLLDDQGRDGKKIVKERREKVNDEIERLERYVNANDREKITDLFNETREVGRSKIMMELRERLSHGKALSFL